MRRAHTRPDRRLSYRRPGLGTPVSDGESRRRDPPRFLGVRRKGSPGRRPWQRRLWSGLRRVESRRVDGRRLGGRGGHWRHRIRRRLRLWVGSRRRLGIGIGRWRNCRGRKLRQEEQRVEIALRVLDAPNAHVDERHRQRRLAARPDRADRFALDDRRTSRDLERAQVEQGDGESARCQERQRLAPVGNGSGERHGGVDRRPHGRSRGGPDVDAPVLPGRLRIRVVEVERPQHRAFDRPRPGPSCCRRDERCQCQAEDEARAQSSRVLSLLQTESHGTCSLGCCQIGLQ
jgi:hypothetical protein